MYCSSPFVDTQKYIQKTLPQIPNPTTVGHPDNCAGVSLESSGAMRPELPPSYVSWGNSYNKFTATEAGRQGMVLFQEKHISRVWELVGKVRKYPCYVISKLFVVSTDTIRWFTFLENPGPPIHEDNNIKQSINARGIESIPLSANLTRDLSAFKRPPSGLNGPPPHES